MYFYSHTFVTSKASCQSKKNLCPKLIQKADYLIQKRLVIFNDKDGEKHLIRVSYYLTFLWSPYGIGQTIIFINSIKVNSHIGILITCFHGNNNCK